MTEERARAALEAQGFTAPGPKVVNLVMDAIACQEEGTLAEARTQRFDLAEVLADTPELVERTEGTLMDTATETTHVLADVLTNAIRYLFDEEATPGPA